MHTIAALLRLSLLTSEFMEGGVRLQVELLPVFVEGLHTRHSRFPDHHFTHFEHNFMEVVTTPYLNADKQINSFENPIPST